MAKEYVEREVALSAIFKTSAILKVFFPEMFNAIKAIPAADVRENVRGEWIDKEVFTAKGNVDMLQSALCPKCGRYHTTPYSYYFTNYEFCPRCGAKMEGQDG